MIKHAEYPVAANIQRNSVSFHWAHSDWPLWLGALALFGIAVVGIGSSWTVLSATYDEPLHIASGMEWLDKGTYNYELLHPPIARAVVVLGLYLKGIRSFSQPDMRDEGNTILYSTGSHSTNLAWARSGNLLFLALACVSVFMWARRWFGRGAAMSAVLLFVNLPPILGHAGLATLDMASAATVAIALYAFIRCLQSPEWPRLILLGAALALAFLCKFSSLVFLGSCFFCALVYVTLGRQAGLPGVARRRILFSRFLIVSGVAFVFVWGGYRFSLQPLSTNRGNHSTIDRRFAKEPILRALAYKVIEAPMPLTQFVKGIRRVAVDNASGTNDSYLFGEHRVTGWWYFFPVVIGVKTPIGFLALTVCGIFLITRNFRSGSWQQHLTVIFPAAIMLVCMKSSIDLGVRHILAIYPFMAVIGGYAVSELFALARRTSPAIAVVPIVLVGWVAFDSWMTRPDYLTYFNQFAGSHPEKILAESDLDWGQDLYRLSRRLKERHIDRVSLKYFGTAPLDKADLPPYSILSPSVPVTSGYAAVSIRYLTLEYAKDGSFAWLRGRVPLETIGKSIYLYKLGQ